MTFMTEVVKVWKQYCGELGWGRRSDFYFVAGRLNSTNAVAWCSYLEERLSHAINEDYCFVGCRDLGNLIMPPIMMMIRYDVQS